MLEDIKKAGPWLIVLFMAISIFYLEFKKDNKPDEQVVTKTIITKDTVYSTDTLIKLVKGRAVITQLPPDTIVTNDTVRIYPKAFSASMDTVVFSKYTFKSGSSVSIRDSARITYKYPADSFWVHTYQTVDYTEVENTITRIVTSELKWYNKPQYTIPIGFVAGGLMTAGIVYMVK